LVEHLFGESADEGLPPEWTMVVLFGALDDVGDMEGTLGDQEYVIYYIHIRLTFGAGRDGRSLGSAAEGAQGTKLSQCTGFKDFNEVILS
jgi:hypothetical protein